MPFNFSASMTRWNPSVSSASVSPTLCSSAADIVFSLCVLPAPFVVGAGRSVEKVAVLLDMRRQPHGVLAHQPRRQIRIAPLQRGDDVAVIDNRTLRTIV